MSKVFSIFLHYNFYAIINRIVSCLELSKNINMRAKQGGVNIIT
jgi:hypothetical protein